MKNYLVFSVATLAVVSNAFAQQRVVKPNLKAYPFMPYETSLIQDKVKALTENEDFLRDIHEMERRGLNKGKTKSQPWGGFYWAIDQGGIANKYQEKSFLNMLDPTRRDWKDNVGDYRKYAQKTHPQIYTISEDKLAKLSPAEKYDILLGDTTFDLTNKVWDYTEKWGEAKRYSFMSEIDMPSGYVLRPLEKDDKKMAAWEGFCHGWALAAGNYPRPLKTVTVTLPNGKKMPFYPTDIKALVTLMWAHSNVQNNIIFEGNRCNSKDPVKDEHGRYLEPECADVHPGVFHAAVVNIVGLEGRSMVVDKAATFAIANQPVAGYELEYFNPKTGDDGALSKSLLSIREYGKDDNFAASRNKEATHIVGVSMKLKYVQWENPKKGKNNEDSDDGIGEMKFNYDLEINQHGEIVGGQWRVKKNGDSAIFGNKTGQPDFFWIAPKDWKKYFGGLSSLPTWDFNKNSLPPRAYQLAALGAHSYVHEESARFLAKAPTCPVIPEKGDLKAVKWVDCAFRLPQPQPLIQVIDKLLEMSRK